MKNEFYLAILVVVISLVQGEASGQISIGLPSETSTAVLTTTTLAAATSGAINPLFIIVPIILIMIVAYAIKRRL